MEHGRVVGARVIEYVVLKARRLANILGGCPPSRTIPAIMMLVTAAAMVLLALGLWRVGDIGFLVGGCLVGHFLFPNNEVQRDNKDDEGDSDQEPPVEFTQEVDTSAVNLNDGDGSVENLDCRDGKKMLRR